MFTGPSDAFRALSACICDVITRFHATHVLTFPTRIKLCIFGLQISKKTILNHDERCHLLKLSLELALRWFTDTPKWPFGRNFRAVQSLLTLLLRCQTELASDRPMDTSFRDFKSSIELLHQLLSNEISRLRVWLNPLQDDQGSKMTSFDFSNLSNILEYPGSLYAKLFVQLSMDTRRAQMRSRFLGIIPSIVRPLLSSSESMHILVCEKLVNKDPNLQKVSIRMSVIHAESE